MYKVLVVLIMVSSWQAMGQDSLHKARRLKKHEAQISQRVPATPTDTVSNRVDTTIHWKSPESWKAQKK